MSTVLDHVLLPVNKTNSAQLVAKYEIVFDTIGVKEIARFGGAGTGKFAVGFGGLVWVIEQEEKPWPGLHTAFRVKTRSEVDNFYATALEQGFKSNGEPGNRPHYGEDYYGAFVIDDAGNNLEVICREATSA